MFGPNTYTEFPSQISYSHRDKQFIETYESVKESFIHKFNLQKYDIMFIGGSGTTGHRVSCLVFIK